MALLDTTETPSPSGWAVASGALLAALMARLVQNGALSEADAGEVVTAARAGLTKFSGHAALPDAVAFAGERYEIVVFRIPEHGLDGGRVVLHYRDGLDPGQDLVNNVVADAVCETRFAERLLELAK